MRRRRDRRREAPASRVPQSDLFARPLVEDHRATAVWRVLPEGTRQVLSGLLARLFLEHEAGARRGGGRHER
jgi:hypothetical protein